MFDISPPTRRPATAVARRRVGTVVNRLVGMGLKRVNSALEQESSSHRQCKVIFVTKGGEMMPCLSRIKGRVGALRGEDSPQ